MRGAAGWCGVVWGDVGRCSHCHPYVFTLLLGARASCPRVPDGVCPALAPRGAWYPKCEQVLPSIGLQCGHPQAVPLRSWHYHCLAMRGNAGRCGRCGHGGQCEQCGHCGALRGNTGRCGALPRIDGHVWSGWSVWGMAGTYSALIDQARCTRPCQTGSNQRPSHRLYGDCGPRAVRPGWILIVDDRSR